MHIKINPDNKLFFTSDQHWNHDNIIRFCNRPYANKQDMMEDMILKWNQVVGEDDIVCVLGDFFWKAQQGFITRNVQRLKGEIFLIPGNHDNLNAYSGLGGSDMFHICSPIENLAVVSCKGTFPIVLSHYPLLTWSHRNWENSYNFFGHIHSQPGSIMGEFGGPLQGLTKGMDVGVDRHGYAPVEFFDLLKETKDYYATLANVSAC